MKPWLYASLAAAGLVAAFAPGRASAQFTPVPSTVGRPPQQPLGMPAFSPYLNLGRSGDPAINYYGVVRPQMAAQQSIQQLQQQQYQLEQAQANLAGTGGTSGLPLPTGHDVRFMNYLHFYPQTTAGLGTHR